MMEGTPMTIDSTWLSVRQSAKVPRTPGGHAETALRSKGALYLFCTIRDYCVVIALLLSCTVQAAGTLDKVAQSGSISLGYRTTSLPLSYLDADKRPIGYSIDICQKIVEAVKRELNRRDIAVKFSEVSSATRMNALIAGEIDLECGSSSVTAERLKLVSFSTPTFITAVRMIVREGSGIKSISNLTKKTVVTTKGTTSEKLFNDLNQVRSLGSSFVLAKDHAESFAMLESGKADAFIMDDVLVYSLRASAKDPTQFTIARDALSLEPIAIMLRKDDPAFSKVVDAEVNRLITQGEMKAIYHKWFESPIPPSQINLNMPTSYMMNEHFKAPKSWQTY
ncbi:MAG: amino acid ABC transporter substrate-binding protein [Betaproteobacteria bacterium]